MSLATAGGGPRAAGFFFPMVDRDAMLLEQLPQVKFIARRIHDRLPRQVDLDDLISAGTLGLMDALKKYDPARNVQFKSYAQFRIRGAILDSLRELDWSPRALRRKARIIQDAQASLAARLMRPAAENEIADELGVPLHEYQLLLGELRGLELGSTCQEADGESSEEELATYIADVPPDDPLTLCLRGELRQTLIDAIETLPERERQVLALYYHEELTMKEIGEVLQVVESRVSQLHTSAVIRLRAFMANTIPQARIAQQKKGSRNK